MAFIVKAEALYDIEDAMSWYRQKSDRVLARFTGELDEYMNYVERNPKHFQIRYKNQRGAPLKKFPYIVMYEIDGSDVIVYAVFNTNQDPEKLNSR